MESYSTQAITYPYNGINKTFATQLDMAFQNNTVLAEYTAFLFLITNYIDGWLLDISNMR